MAIPKPNEDCHAHGTPAISPHKRRSIPCISASRASSPELVTLQDEDCHKCSPPGIVAINGQDVLSQIVGANRDKSTRFARCGSINTIDGTSSMCRYVVWEFRNRSSPRLHVRQFNQAASFVNFIEACDHRQQIFRLPVAALARSIARTWIKKSPADRA